MSASGYLGQASRVARRRTGYAPGHESGHTWVKGLSCREEDWGLAESRGHREGGQASQLAPKGKLGTAETSRPRSKGLGSTQERRPSVLGPPLEQGAFWPLSTSGLSQGPPSSEAIGWLLVPAPGRPDFCSQSAGAVAVEPGSEVPNLERGLLG